MNNLKNKLTSIYKNHKILFSSLIALLFLNYLILIILKLTPYKDLKDFQNKDYSIRYYDRNNILLQVSSIDDGLKREFTPLNEIPKDVKKAFLTAEDKRFYFHQGVDLIALTGALIQNSKSRRIVRGGSTITMQLAKTINNSSEVTVSRKLKDILTSFRIEAKLTKKQILELYLNTIYLGYGSYGVDAAAKAYFSKDVSELTLLECAQLAALPQSPTAYSPLKRIETSKIEDPDKYDIKYKYDR